MAAQATPANNRSIPVELDNRGRPLWRSRMSAPDDSVGVCTLVPDRVIPVIFVPGVMGSNLTQRNPPRDGDDPVQWRMDGAGTATDWAGPSKGAAYRKRWLQPSVMQVDTQGKLPESSDAGGLPKEEMRRRGWGEVGFMSYGTFLPLLEAWLNDFEDCQGGQRVGLMDLDLQAFKDEVKLTLDEVGLSYRYRFPVWACGYNWLDDNAKSAQRLASRIDEIRTRYQRDKVPCDKVIVVTHSMGGLVARHCSEVLGRGKDMLGIVHGVMPAIGAAAVYRRMKAGTEDPTGWYNVAGSITASVLGNDAGEVTAVMSSSPGPLQLLPTPEYGNGWLRVRDGSVEHSLPKSGDPYQEIYTVRGKWWGLAEDHLINPLNTETNAATRQLQVETDWAKYKQLIETVVRPFQEGLSQKYHPNTYAFYGSSAEHRAFGNITWSVSGAGRTYLMPGQPMSGTLANLDSTGDTRAVQMQVPLPPNPRAGPNAPARSGMSVRQFKLAAADENGDGTVPHRSGHSAAAHVRSCLRVNVEHEPCYKGNKGGEYLRACQFTLRAIVKLAQGVTATAIHYD